MAQMLWRTSDDGLSSALAAALLCRNVAKLDQRDTDIIEIYKRESEFYERSAVEIYQISYSKDPNTSYKLLTRVCNQWGKRTCLELAVESECREFMSIVGVQEQLSMIWRGNISMKQPYTAVFIALTFSPLLWFLPQWMITFDDRIPHYRRKRKRQLQGEHDAHTKWWKKFMWLYQAPVSVFWFNVVFYFLFLAWFAIVLVSEFCLRPTWKEYLGKTH